MNRPIVTALDYTGCAEEVFAVAMRQAKAFDARLILVYVVQRPSGLPEDTAIEQLMGLDAHQELRIFAQAGRAAGLDVDIMVRSGAPAQQILAVARSSDAQQIVMGTHGRAGLSRLWSGSVAESVVRHAVCPVTVVRTQPPPLTPALPRRSVTPKQGSWADGAPASPPPDDFPADVASERHHVRRVRDLIGDPGDQIAVHATGVDPGERAQVHVEVDREAVPGDPPPTGDADGGDLAPADPDAGVALVADTDDAVVYQGGHDGLFEPTQVAMQVVPVLGEGEDGVPGQLAGAMVGHIPTAPDREDRDIAGVEDIARGPAGAAEGEHRLMLDEQQRVRNTAGDAIGEDLLHDRM
ncbi:MAG: universal stress protein [Myxococcota bacterium]